ncbi:MAG: hypothetical protein U0136_12530 [Bdellovibrionota bacterium]
MLTRTKFVLRLFVVSSMTACAPGLIYTDVTSPLTRNLDNARIGTKSGSTSTTELSIPLNRGSISGAFESRAIGDAAQNGGLTTLYYADERLISVLGGLWKKRTVTVHGD